MLSPEEEALVPEELVVKFTPERKRKFPLAAGLVLCVVFATALGRYQPTSTYAAADTVVTDKWLTLTHKAIGYSPCYRVIEHGGGITEAGPLQDGERHGRWTVSNKGMVTYQNYDLGKRR